MTRYIVSTESDCRRMAREAMQRNQIPGNPNGDGKPYRTLYSGRVTQGRTTTGRTEHGVVIGDPTGNWLWVPERDADVRAEDASKEVAERDLPEEFRHVRTRTTSAPLEGGR